MSFRRGPNMSHYNTNLNLINPISEPSLDSVDDGYEQGDINVWSNSDFFDFDMGEPLSNVTPDMERLSKAATMNQELFDSEAFKGFELENIDFSALDTYPTAFQPLQSVQIAPHPVALAAQQQQQLRRPTPIAPQTARPHLNILPQPPQSTPVSPQTFTSPALSESPISSANNLKRKSFALDSNSPASFEDSSRFAAEEDKRRRNTAASARFRVKKKQREQAMEQQNKTLEKEVETLKREKLRLESENQFLRNLLTEKHDGDEKVAEILKKKEA